MRYIIAHEIFEKIHYRFVYDRKYKTFAILQQFGRDKGNKENKTIGWYNELLAPPTFYSYFPGFTEKYRESDSLPNWK